MIEAQREIGHPANSEEVVAVRTRQYFGPFFDNQGSAGWEEIKFDGDTWTWNGENVMGVRYHRCKALFKNEKTIKAIHEHSEDGEEWHEWMDITLSKTK